MNCNKQSHLVSGLDALVLIWKLQCMLGLLDLLSGQDENYLNQLSTVF